MLLLLFQRRPKTQINSIDDKWIKLRQNEYGVSFQKPKKRHSIKREDFNIICKTYRQFAHISRKTGIKCRFIGMRVRRRRLQQLKTETFIKNQNLSRERVTVLIQVPSSLDINLKLKIVFTGKGTRTKVVVDSWISVVTKWIYRLEHMLKTINNLPNRKRISQFMYQTTMPSI